MLDGDIVVASSSDIEIELVDGDEHALRAIEEQLREAGARDADRRSKLQRALDLTPLQAAEIPDDPTPAERLQAVVAVQYRAILANDPGTRLGTDAEHLHQHRVAVRRLRSDAASRRPDARPHVDEVHPRRAALGRKCAWVPVRDLDVLIDHLRAEIATLPAAFGPDDPESLGSAPLIDALEREHERARAAMLEALRSDRYLRLLELLEAAAVGGAGNHGSRRLAPKARP